MDDYSTSLLEAASKSQLGRAAVMQNRYVTINAKKATKEATRVMNEVRAGDKPVSEGELVRVRDMCNSVQNSFIAGQMLGQDFVKPASYVMQNMDRMADEIGKQLKIVEDEKVSKKTGKPSAKAVANNPNKQVTENANTGKEGK